VNIEEFKAKYSDQPSTVLKLINDWQLIAMREAGELVGMPEATAKLAEVRRYEFLGEAFKFILKGKQ
jgi:hypothetical protein